MKREGKEFKEEEGGQRRDISEVKGKGRERSEVKG